MRKAFSLLELFVTIALTGAITFIATNLINTKYLSKESIKLEIKSHLNLITATILQCKEYSGMMPIQENGSLASDTLVSSLECNTTTPYPLDGGKGSFIPVAPDLFTAYKATQNLNEFYFSTTAQLNTYQSEVLEDLNATYSPNQYELTDDGTTATLNFYLSR